MQANLRALIVLQEVRRGDRPATAQEQEQLARWSSWGAVPQIFDEQREDFTGERKQLRGLLDEHAYAAARRTTINAHYTDPAYAQAIWDALEQLGFDGGEVLEPGCGSGTFIGMAPDEARLTGVELDPTTAAIAAALYPHASIRGESFADTRLPAGFFDATIGNVPFAPVALHDPRHNRDGHTMHNHFIIKSLDLTRPGGIVAVLTSRYTLDARNPAARREMNARADLLGAVRLPTGAHRRAAGTDAITDLLMFRRREPGRAPAATAWEGTRPVLIDGETERINNYFDHTPEHVLGHLQVGHGAYNAQTLLVRGDLQDTAARLAGALSEITTAAQRAGLAMSVRDDRERAPERVAKAGSELWDGHITAEPSGSFARLRNGAHEPMTVPRTQQRELRALLGLRDGATDLLRVEAATLEDTPEIDVLRAQLRAAYSEYTARYGPLNRFTLRSTGREDPETGEMGMARITPPALRLLRDDPFGPLTRSIEVFDDMAQTASPAALLRERMILPRTPVLGADTPQDALAVTLDTHGRVDLAEIARLLGQDEQQTRDELGQLVYDDPAAGRLVPAAEYLSGDVREKLEHARQAAEQNPALAVNVTALEGVLPRDLGIEEIQARIGAVWIDTDTHAQFLREILDDPSIRVEHPGGSMWEVRGNTYSVAATSEWGTARIDAPAIAKKVLEQRTIQITDDRGDGTRVLNPVETAAAQEKAGAMQERFSEWVWEDDARAQRLLREYNRRFNSIVLRDYTSEGERLTLPGLARTFAPREHQRGAVARMLSEPAVGLFHQVGAGKTAEMVMGTMELRRLGMTSKPAVVVPNHMLEQFSREWLQLYPQARVLAASSEDLAGEHRRAFVARAATNDWDAIIMTRSAFERIPLSPDAQVAYERKEIASLRAMLENARAGEGLTVKRLERMVLTREQRLADRLDGARDPGITFEMTGVDYLVVDEMHDYKNLQTVSNIRDAAIDGSKRASDLHMKTEYLRERHGERVITAATATPIANSVTEAHVMARYLRPDLLRAAGVEDFDSWAATFGQTVTEIEMAPTGGGSYRMQTRFSRFQNVPEMLRMWHVFADVKTAEDLNLPTPAIQPRGDGRRVPETIVIEPTPEIRDYVAGLGERAEKVRARGVAPEEDNMLKISTDGRKAALDMRMVSSQPPTGPTKIDRAAENIARIHHQHADRVYTDPETGEPAARPGALQIVFCDLGTPGPGWNAYDELREQLAARGVPREAVRYIHEARNDSEKARLFAAARNGDVAVLIGSTQKMGVGTNIQTRAIALHHLDCPWRPADLEQRDGRILRQGNQNPEVGLYRYVVQESFDAYSWQTVARKARFINQITRGRLDTREIEDIGDNALSFAEVKALASGDTLIMDQARADAETTRLQRLQRAHQRNHALLNRTLTDAQATITGTEKQLADLQAAIAARQDTRGDAFEITIADRTLNARADAGQHLTRWITDHTHGGMPWGRAQHPLGPVGTLGGLDIHAALRLSLDGRPNVELALAGVPAPPASLTLADARADAQSLIRQLEHRLNDLPALQGRVETNLARATTQAASAQDALAKPFKHADALAAAQKRSQDIANLMQARQQPETATPEPASAHMAATATPDGWRPVPPTTPGVAKRRRAQQPQPGRDNEPSR